MNDLVATASKAELHCHCDGVVDPQMLRDLSSDCEDLEPTALALEAVYPVTSVEHWSTVYQPILHQFFNPLPTKLALVAMTQRERWRRQDAHYAELFISGILGAVPAGEPLREWFRSLTADLASFSSGPEMQLVVCLSRLKLVRHLPAILDLAQHALVAGVAIAGDELACPIRDLHQPLAQLHERNVPLEIHAGETGGPDSVRDALDFGRPNRIGHGVRAFEEPSLIDRLVRERVHLEFCPTSNLRLGVIPNIEELPIRRALDAGVSFSINTDDPGVFQCSLTSELELVQETFELDDSDLQHIYDNSISAAFRRIPSGA